MTTAKNTANGTYMFEDIANCRAHGREQQIAVCSFLGTLIRSSDPFPYFMLLALESGSIFRALLLLVCFPISLLLQFFVSEEAALQMQIFVTFCGIKASTVELLSKTVIAKSYFDDINPLLIPAFASFGKKYVITVVPRILVEPFLKEYVGVEAVIGSNLQVLRNGYCTGLTRPGTALLTSGSRKLESLKEFFSNINISSPDVGFGCDSSDYPFMSWSKEAFTVRRQQDVPPASSPQQSLKPLIFHDGRLAVLPTPAMTLTIILWTPFAILLALLRIMASHSPYSFRFPLTALLGVKVRVKGCFPAPKRSFDEAGTLFVCSHKTLLDPLVLSSVLKWKLTAVTYSISWLTEILSSIKTVRLSRDRISDSKLMQRLLQTEDVVICPEGTTCREPYLLRFSPLFAEVSNKIVPVLMNVRTPLFYGTTAKGWKWLDPFFFCMNPKPSYVVEFLEQLPVDKTCAGGKSCIQVANHIQEELAKASGFKCTGMSRKNKYRFLAGNDGT